MKNPTTEELAYLADQQAHARSRYAEDDSGLIRESRVIEWALRHCAALRASAPTRQPPTIAELQAVLDNGTNQPVRIMPDGSVVDIDPAQPTAICAVSPPSPDTVREKDRADLAEKHLNQIYDYLGCCRSGSAVICTIKEREAALSSAPVAGAWQEVLKPFADLADAMYVSGHCGGASPEDWPDKWPISTTGGRDQHMPQSQGGVLTVADFRKLSRIYHSLSRNDRGGSAQ